MPHLRTHIYNRGREVDFPMVIVIIKYLHVHRDPQVRSLLHNPLFLLGLRVPHLHSLLHNPSSLLEPERLPALSEDEPSLVDPDAPYLPTVDLPSEHSGEHSDGLEYTHNPGPGPERRGRLSASTVESRRAGTIPEAGNPDAIPEDALSLREMTDYWN
ncbi:hypothetical protein HO173_003286 [Letharia columbiana]|uniref:Uncharacterized protein n=1 Tax=Letharia columbiana TaxID=112416 RepID=A0A8H6G1H7_9LECA|nr:uncharacterized protein HO173_003286 [Letharia columbiana]KAF6238779.1 hypothetical protein HO173_003286 [Letharia columbiana]